jgi:hypothetical protein
MTHVHIHEFFVAVSDGVAGAWPAERCLGYVPEAEARRLLATEEPTVLPRGDLTGASTWQEMPGSPSDCWLSGRGFVT